MRSFGGCKLHRSRETVHSLAFFFWGGGEGEGVVPGISASLKHVPIAVD